MANSIYVMIDTQYMLRLPASVKGNI